LLGARPCGKQRPCGVAGYAQTIQTPTRAPRSRKMQKVTPCLWFDGQAEEAANFYVSIFKNSKTGQILRWGKEAPDKQGSVLLVTFELDGQTYQALNGGPEFHFTEAISLSIDCKDQKEVDYFWD